MEEKKDLEKLIVDAREYIETRSELSKLQALEKGSEIAGSTSAGVILLSFFLLFLIFASIAAALLIAEWSGKNSTGFLAIAGFYLFAGILLAINKDRWIKTPVMNSVIRNFFKDKDGKN